MASNENKKQAEDKELQEALASKESTEEVSATETTDEESKETKETKEETTSKDESTEETSKDEAPKEGSDTPAEEPAETPGIASFEKAQKNQTALIVVVTIVAFLVIIFIAKSLSGGLGGMVTYENSVHGYSYKYPADLELVAEGNIPQELQDQGVQSMAQLNLTQGDSLLVRKTEDGGDNIVYTVLELSSRPNFGDFESYTTALFASLDESKEQSGIDYALTDSTVGEGIVSKEYSFEMEVPIDADGNTRTGVFYDNVFETPDGRAYSVSFGYPKDVPNPEEYVAIYRDILASFDINEADDEATEEVMEDDSGDTMEVADDEDVMTEEIVEVTEEEVIETVE